MDPDTAFAFALVAGGMGGLIAVALVWRFWRMRRSGALDPLRFGDRSDNDPRY